MFISVGKNKIKFESIEWFKMYSLSDDRIVGRKGNFEFATYPYKLKDGQEVFNPFKKDIDQTYLDSYIFTPNSFDRIKLVKI